MPSWADIAADAPGFATSVRSLFTGRRHCTLATLRADGSPRISGIEVDFGDDEIKLGMMEGSRKAADLHRDPRFALHSPSVDPPDDPTAWPGEAKLSGRAEHLGENAFRLDIDEVSWVRVGTPADHLVIESWHAGRGFARRTRV